jgi:oligosaccharide repeat unit polymerase
LYLVGYVPAVVVPLLVTGELGRVLPLAVALLGAMAIVSVIVRFPAPLLRLPHLSSQAFTWLLVGLSGLSSAYVIAVFGVHSLPSLGDVYTARAQFDTALGSAPAAGYVVPWAANAINPLLMALGAVRRRLDFVVLALVGQLLIYAVTGFKSVLFSILLIPLVYLAVGVARRRFGLVAVGMAPAILAGCVAASSVTGEWSLALGRRLFATPGQVGWYFYDYYSTHPKHHLSHSFLGWLTQSNYVDAPPTLIGRVYFPESTPNANAHLWADAFANFGFAGIFVFSVVLGLFLVGLDALGRGRDMRVAGPMLAIAGMSLASSALFTTMLTLGFGLACLLMALMPPLDAHAREGPRPPTHGDPLT